jgi:hypothetical protein
VHHIAPEGRSLDSCRTSARQVQLDASCNPALVYQEYGVPREEFVKLIHTLIDNHQIKDILLPEWFDETSDRSVIPIPQTEQRNYLASGKVNSEQSVR